MDSTASDAGPAGNPPADLLDDLIALVTPDRLLGHPRATGEGIRVAVIDSGIDRSLLQTKWRERGHDLVPGEGAVFVPGQTTPGPDEGRQSSPHGTTVADIILTLAPRVQLFSADVFGPAGHSEIETVLRALHWAVHVWKCKLVNLSLGIPEHRLQQVPVRYQLLRAVEDAYYNDVLLVAAAHNEHPLTRSYPAVFSPPLLSVDKHLFQNPLDFAYRLNEQVEFQAHGRGYLGPFAYEPATSWAVPHMVGIAARLLSLRPTLKPFEIKTLLYWMAQASSQR